MQIFCSGFDLLYTVHSLLRSKFLLCLALKTVIQRIVVSLQDKAHDPASQFSVSECSISMTILSGPVGGELLHDYIN